MHNAATVLDAQPRAIAEWSLESPVIGNGHAGFGRRASEKDPQGHLADAPPHGEPSAGRRGTGGWTSKSREVCVMQSAETVLDVLRDPTTVTT